MLAVRQCGQVERYATSDISEKTAAAKSLNTVAVNSAIVYTAHRDARGLYGRYHQPVIPCEIPTRARRDRPTLKICGIYERRGGSHWNRIGGPCIVVSRVIVVSRLCDSIHRTFHLGISYFCLKCFVGSRDNR